MALPPPPKKKHLPVIIMFLFLPHVQVTFIYICVSRWHMYMHLLVQWVSFCIAFHLILKYEVLNKLACHPCVCSTNVAFLSACLPSFLPRPSSLLSSFLF